MSVHHVRKVLFFLRPADATNGEFKILSYLAWDAHHDGRRWRTTLERIAARSGFVYETVRNAIDVFESRGWMRVKRGPRGRIVDWKLMLPDKPARLGETCGKPRGKAVSQLRISPAVSRVGDRQLAIEGSPVGDPTVEKTAATDEPVGTSPIDPSLDPSFDPSITKSTERRSRGASSSKLHFENAVSEEPPVPPPALNSQLPTHREGLDQLRLTMARIAAAPAPKRRRRSTQ